MDISEYIRHKTKKLERGDRSIKDYKVFDFNYVPPKPIMRDEIRPVADAVLRYVKTGIPNHSLIIGSRGSGKTLAVRSLAKTLEQSSDSPRFLYINCRHHNTSFKILAEVLGARPRGYALDELWNQFEQKYSGRVILILDEVDLISEKDRNKDILYLLSRSPNNYMAILLSNNPRFHTLLDPSIKSTLQPEIVHFKDYSGQQVFEILAATGRLGAQKGGFGNTDGISRL